MSELEAGPEVDAAIAQRIFGVKRLYYPSGPDWPYYIPSGKPWRTHSIDNRPLPHFSRDPAAAMTILDRAEYWQSGYIAKRDQDGNGPYYSCTLAWELMGPLYSAHALTWPLAVCAAALASKEGS